MRILQILGFCLVVFAFSSTAEAHQYCENVVVGYQQVQVGENCGQGVCTPIYQQQPTYQQQCVWKYGAVAVDPQTREVSSAWNYDSPDAARDYVLSSCGQHCVWVSFGEDYAWIALSDDDRSYGYSTSSAEDARIRCGMECTTVVSAGSGGAAVYWRFGSIACDAATGSCGMAWNHYRMREAEAAAMQSCGQPGCWPYSFQSGFGGIARAPDGNLFAYWSRKGEKDAGREAKEDCDKAKKDLGKKVCEILMTGSAYAPSSFKPPTPKKVEGVVKPQPKLAPRQLEPGDVCEPGKKCVEDQGEE